jgi:hypothetical protein
MNPVGKSEIILLNASYTGSKTQVENQIVVSALIIL